MTTNIKDSKHQASLLSTLCLHGMNLTHLRACSSRPNGYFEHNLPLKSLKLSLTNICMLSLCAFEALICLLHIAVCFSKVPNVR